jgi:hypothetical protein
VGVAFQLTVSFRLDDYPASKEASAMRKALPLSELTAMLFRARDPRQALLDYALIAGAIAAAGATIFTILRQGSVGAALARIVGSFSG